MVDEVKDQLGTADNEKAISPSVEAVPIDYNAEKKIVRKLDLHLIPIVMLLYLLSFLDRVNIGNARLYGLESDLHMVGNDYLTAVSLLFVTYIAFEVPSNLVLKKFTPSRFISAITIIWGLIATFTGLCQSFGGLIACRLLLGVVEAGLFPCCALYLTFFYTKRELALRIGYLFVSAALAGAFGGLLAYGIGHLDHVRGLRGWRYIMIIEGLPTIVLGIAVFFLLPNEPETAYFLLREEKDLMFVRRARDQGQTDSAQLFHKDDVKKAFLDWKIYAFMAGQFGADTVLYGYSTFLPTIIQGIGTWTTAQVQLLTIPCYALGAVTYLTVATYSDRHQMRGVYCVALGIAIVIGYGLLISPSSARVHYAGCFLVAMGLYVVVGLPLAWIPNNNPRFGKRATATGLQLTVGNASGIMTPFIYPAAQGPRYVKGHAITMALAGMSTVIYGFMWFYFSRRNVNRAAGREDHKTTHLTDEEILELGDES